MKVIIVGGVAGGASAAARLRRLNEDAEIIILERGGFISYANCGLPYYIGDDITEKSALILQTPESFYQRFRIEVRTYHEAVAIDKEQKKLTVRNENGEIYEEHFDKLILSLGAKPILPRMEGIESKRIFTLRNVPDTFEIKEFIEQNHPKKALVVGGGYIGVEMAENLHKNGIEVTIAEAADHVIGPLDYDMACDVHHYLRTKGIHLRLKTKVAGFEEKENGIEALFENEKEVFDFVLMSVGVTPDTKIAKECGLELNQRGAILVDQFMKTSAKDIYAVGDAAVVKHFITGEEAFLPLAGPANKQGRIAADNICDLDSYYKGSQGSSILKLFDMTVAATGLSETVAKAAGYETQTAYAFSASHATYYPGASNMCIKLVFDKNRGKVLGAQIVGFEGVDKRCDVLATAIRAGMTVYDLTELELCYAPPFSSAKDPVNMAGFIAENVLTDKVRQFYWRDVAEVQKKKDAVLLDIRTEGEYQRGHIEGTLHIPVDSLREHLKELDQEKEIYVICQSGLRSYIACRILKQHGYTCYNLAGGYRLYDSVTREVQFDSSLKQPCGMNI